MQNRKKTKRKPSKRDWHDTSGDARQNAIQNAQPQAALPELPQQAKCQTVKNMGEKKRTLDNVDAETIPFFGLIKIDTKQ